ncbi:hypothetical protein [Bacteroides sp.]|uniref:hypothetical protein n=1 Tax=Bacteroides sp. TaxID=29523 RepID=UPI003A929DE7
MTKEENNNTFRYVVTPFRFTGAVITSMSDGIHNDYDKGETLDMLRERYKNPWLITVTVEEIHAMIIKYQTSLQTSFEEITEHRYWDLLGCVPPKRQRSGSFFVGEAYYGSIYRFCFELDGKYYSALRDIRLTDEELYKQRRKFARVLKRTEGRIRKRPGDRTRLPRKEKKRNYGKHRDGLVQLLENALMDMGYEYDIIHEFFCHHYKGRLKMNPAKQLFVPWYYENEKEFYPDK